MDRDTFVEDEEAKAFGVIDEVFDRRPEPGQDSGTGLGMSLPLSPFRSKWRARRRAASPLPRQAICSSTR
jgi:hypothetical protein